MNDFWITLNSIVLVIAIGFAIRSLLRNTKARTKGTSETTEVEQWEKGAQMAANNEEYRAWAKEISGQGNNDQSFRIYEEESDPEMRHYRRNNFVTSHSQDTDRLSNPYNQETWRFMMPHSAVDMLIEGCDGNERKAYLFKRSIELSIEHYVLEMIDDAECAKIIHEREYHDSTLSLNLDEYKQYRNERLMVDGDYESVAQWKERTNKMNKARLED